MNKLNRRTVGALAMAAAASLLVLSVTAPTSAARKKPRPTPSPSPTSSPSPSPSPSPTSSPAPTSTPTSVTLAPGSVSPATITGGDGAVQTIKLTGPAPAGGMYVSIHASDGIYTASAGSSVRVPPGATSVSFPFRLAAPSTDVVRSLWAQIPGSPLTKVAEVKVLAADPATRAVTSLDIDADAAVAGTSTTGTVTLKNPAPEGGISVALWSNTSYGPGVYIPLYVVVEAGKTTASFTASVTSASEPAIVRPSADIGTSRVNTKLVVVPETFAIGLGVARPGTVSEMAVGIGTAPNPTGTTVTLHSDTPGVTVPQAVTIPAGSPGVAFPVTVAGSVPLGGAARITATWNGVSATAPVYIN